MNATGQSSSEVGYREGSVSSAGVAAYASPACPLCGSDANSRAFTDGGCEVRVCEACELFFVHPYPRAREQHQRVSSGQYPGIALLDCARRYQGEQLYYQRHFDLIAQEVAGASSILDVGCGTGHLLERFASRPGTFRLGIELNPAAASFARRTAGCEVLEAPFERFRSDRKFDAITLINVFSHIPSFGGTFESLRAALASGGRVVLRTTEMSRGVSRWNQVHWGVPDDLHFLGLSTIDRLCARYGFKVARHIRVPYEDELFRPSRWKQMGRNPWLNAMKWGAVRIPGALATFRKIYTAALGQRLFISFVVLKLDTTEEHGSRTARWNEASALQKLR